MTMPTFVSIRNPVSQYHELSMNTTYKCLKGKVQSVSETNGNRIHNKIEENVRPTDACRTTSGSLAELKAFTQILLSLSVSCDTYVT